MREIEQNKIHFFLLIKFQKRDAKTETVEEQYLTLTQTPEDNVASTIDDANRIGSQSTTPWFAASSVHS